VWFGTMSTISRRPEITRIGPLVHPGVRDAVEQSNVRYRRDPSEVTRRDQWGTRRVTCAYLV
jgi:hypothetical protein